MNYFNNSSDISKLNSNSTLTITDANKDLIYVINKSIYQFIDHISSEITGSNFRVTGFRA